jgi:methylene-fatty-acyl-phospholipid synthase
MSTDISFLDAVKNQPSLAILDNKLVKAAAVAFFAAGQIFVLSSMWVLGVTGE